MAAKESKMKNVVVDSEISDREEENETDLGKESKMKNVVVDGIDQEEEEENETKTGTDLGEDMKMKNVVRAVNELNVRRTVRRSFGKNETSDQEEEENESKTGTDLELSLDKLSLGPNKKLLVISLNGFIVQHYGEFLFSKRPFCEEFLKFCFERFEVGLWSSAVKDNVEAVLTKAIGELKNKFLFIWNQKHCTKTGYKPSFLKELKYVWEKKYSCGEYSASNTLLITAPDKALLNPPNTGIFPKEYDAKNKNDEFLGPNGELRLFLDGLVEAKDVQSYVKEHPFGEPAITSSHPDWRLYLNIFQYFGKKGVKTPGGSKRTGRETKPSVWQKNYVVSKK